MTDDDKRLYDIWHGMCRRCHDKRRKDYSKYGGRGIRVCPSWRGTTDPHSWNRDGFEVFKTWALKRGYTSGMTLDRASNNRGYSPENCRWITRRAQAYNRKTNNHMTVNGVTRTLTEWAALMGLPDYVICKRRARGWTDEEAITTPLNCRRKRK